METVIVKKTTVKQQLSDILLDVSFASISRRYFNKSPSCLHHKLNGRDSNGGASDFTPEEKEQLRGALCDLADRIRRASDNIE